MTQRRALNYAEDSLGVHRVYTDSENIVLQLQELYKKRAGLETESRNMATDIERHRASLLDRETLANPEMSVTAHERHMKLVYARDEKLREMTDTLNQVMAERDLIDADIRGRETNHKGHVARMNELGGYFSYLAMAKNAQLVAMSQMSDYPW